CAGQRPRHDERHRARASGPRGGARGISGRREAGMSALFFEEDSVWIFILVTVLLGGGAALLTGRAIARTWQPFRIAALYMLPLAAAVRFFHYALFGGTLLSLHYYVVDYLIVT